MNNQGYNVPKLALALLVCAALRAQDGMAQSVDNRVGTDPLYIQVFGGINKSANENLPWTEFSGYPVSGGFFLGIGREYSELWGWRAALRYNRNKSRNVEECESKEVWAWSSVGLFADATFDITDALRGVRGRAVAHAFNCKAFAGVGAAYTFGFDDVPLSYAKAYSRDGRVVPAVRAGLTATLRLSDRWRIGTELSHTMFADRFNGVKDGFPSDGRTNLKVGFAVLLGKRTAKPVAAKQPVVYANRLRTIPELPFVMPDAESVKKRTVTGRAFLDFPVNETVIYPSYRRNPQEIRRIVATIDSALFDKTMQITRISLHGYASPESPYSNNARLAKGRTAALQHYLSGHYGISDGMFETAFTSEDWDNLRGFIANADRRRTKGDIWYESASVLETPDAPAVVTANRDELLRVIDLDIDADEKEERLKLVGGGEPYRWLLKYVYPGLRHTDYVIDYVVRNYPVKQSRRLIYTHPEALSLNEMYAVAGSYGRETDGWVDALVIAARQYPDSPTANLNAACACVEARRVSDAKAFLAKAGSTPQALYLADIIRAMEGKAQWKIDNGKLIITDNK